MLSRITKKFRELKKSGHKAFVPFITAGDPDLRTTEKIILALEQCGASIIELGVPFSDPMADGVTIQKSYARALKKNVSLTSILKLVKTVRKKSEMPILLMGYFNPILQYDPKKFVGDCITSGVDGLLIVDLPLEESRDFRRLLRGKPLDLIYLLSPTSTPDRVSMVNRHGSGFIYYVSMTGITGATHLDTKLVLEHVKKIKQHAKLPVCVGFGISTVQQVKELSQNADGVVVGSALVKIIEKSKSQSPKKIARLAVPLIQAVGAGLKPAPTPS